MPTQREPTRYVEPILGRSLADRIADHVMVVIYRELPDVGELAKCLVPIREEVQCILDERAEHRLIPEEPGRVDAVKEKDLREGYDIMPEDYLKEAKP